MKTPQMCVLAELQKEFFVRLQRDFYWKCGEHKELSQYFWEAMYTTLLITSNSVIFGKLPTGEDGEVI